MQVIVDLRRSVDGRLEGTLTTDAGIRHRFTGTLDLLGILERLDLDDPASDPEPDVR